VYHIYYIDPINYFADSLSIRIDLGIACPPYHVWRKKQAAIVAPDAFGDQFILALCAGWL
jgi:hypothetical protein